jgi:peptidoglycan/LPS O-acetylase OafA/YrhL
LRAIAIILVLLVHTHVAVFPGGAIGVDIFFVLSGYLITTILVGEIERTGTINLKNFFARRALRLMPALLLLCLVQFARAPFSMHPSQVREATLVGILYLQNWNVIFQWAPNPDLMGPTWSLAIEEQFYWIWPIALLLVFKRQPRAWLIAALVVMLVARAASWRQEPVILQQTFLRPCGLLIGCLLALTPQLRAIKPKFWALPALIAATIALALFTNETALPSLMLAPLAASMIAAGMILYAKPDCFLAAAPLRYVGKISYGLYLYHMPVLILAKSPKLPHVPEVALIAVSFAAAALSYEFVEKPILGLKARFTSGGRSIVSGPQGSSIHSGAPSSELGDEDKATSAA